MRAITSHAHCVEMSWAGPWFLMVAPSGLSKPQSRPVVASSNLDMKAKLHPELSLKRSAGEQLCS